MRLLSWHICSFRFLQFLLFLCLSSLQPSWLPLVTSTLQSIAYSRSGPTSLPWPAGWLLLFLCVTVWWIDPTPQLSNQATPLNFFPRSPKLQHWRITFAPLIQKYRHWNPRITDTGIHRSDRKVDISNKLFTSRPCAVCWCHCERSNLSFAGL